MHQQKVDNNLLAIQIIFLYHFRFSKYRHWPCFWTLQGTYLWQSLDIQVDVEHDGPTSTRASLHKLALTVLHVALEEDLFMC